MTRNKVTFSKASCRKRHGVMFGNAATTKKPFRMLGLIQELILSNTPARVFVFVSIHGTNITFRLGWPG